MELICFPPRPSNDVTLEDENPYDMVDLEEMRDLERERRKRIEGEPTKSAAIHVIPRDLGE